MPEDGWRNADTRAVCLVRPVRVEDLLRVHGIRQGPVVQHRLEHAGHDNIEDRKHREEDRISGSGGSIAKTIRDIAKATICLHIAHIAYNMSVQHEEQELEERGRGERENGLQGLLLYRTGDPVHKDVEHGKRGHSESSHD